MLITIGQFVEPAVPQELRSRVYFLLNDCRDIWEWSEKAYEYIRRNDAKKQLSDERAVPGR